MGALFWLRAQELGLPKFIDDPRWLQKIGDCLAERIDQDAADSRKLYLAMIDKPDSSASGFKTD